MVGISRLLNTQCHVIEHACHTTLSTMGGSVDRSGQPCGRLRREGQGRGGEGRPVTGAAARPCASIRRRVGAGEGRPGTEAAPFVAPLAGEGTPGVGRDECEVGKGLARRGKRTSGEGTSPGWEEEESGVGRHESRPRYQE